MSKHKCRLNLSILEGKIIGICKKKNQINKKEGIIDCLDDLPENNRI
jgi:hypothetical protein